MKHNHPSDLLLGHSRGIFPEATDDVDPRVAPEVRQYELVHVGTPQSGEGVTDHHEAKRVGRHDLVLHLPQGGATSAGVLLLAVQG